MKLALFDFDGTITNRDSLSDFIVFVHGPLRYLAGLAVNSPVLLAWKLGLVSAQQAKQRLLNHFFAGWHQEKFQTLGRQYALQRVPLLIREQARQKLLWHQSNGHHVVIVTASVDDWIRAWADQQGIDLIATQLAFDQSRVFTGRFSSANCQGKEKVVRIHQKLQVQAYDYIYAYGDSRGDREMLALADESHFKPFRG